MTREIKFRAWDEVRKNWLKEDEYIISSDGGVIDVFVHTNGIDVEILDVNEHAILEQNTGLKDKNDVPIFEGDIVKVFDGEDIEDPYCAYLEINYEQGKFYFHGAYAVTFDDVVEDEVLDVEVVGNIHENTDLLEETKCERLSLERGTNRLEVKKLVLDISMETE